MFSPTSPSIRHSWDEKEKWRDGSSILVSSEPRRLLTQPDSVFEQGFRPSSQPRFQ